MTLRNLALLLGPATLFVRHDNVKHSAINPALELLVIERRAGKKSREEELRRVDQPTVLTKTMKQAHTTYAA